MALRALLISLLLTPQIYAAEAVIDGPETTESGNLVVLDAGASRGNNYKWIQPGSVSLPESKDHKLYGVLPPGTYVFHYVASDADGIDVATITLEVRDMGQPTERVNLDLVREASFEGAEKVDDAVTVERLIAGLKNLTGSPKDLSNKVDDILLTRGPEERDYDWLNLWKIPLNAAITEASPSLDQTAEVAKAIVDGLKKYKQQNPVIQDVGVPVLTMVTMNNCEGCKVAETTTVIPFLFGWKWKKHNVDIDGPIPGVRIFPSYYIEYRGERSEIIAPPDANTPVTAEQLRKAAGEMG